MKRSSVILVLIMVATGFCVAQDSNRGERSSLLSQIKVGQQVNYANRALVVLRLDDVKKYQETRSPFFTVREVHREFIVREAVTKKGGPNSLEIAVTAPAIDEIHRYVSSAENSTAKKPAGWQRIISAETL